VRHLVEEGVQPLRSVAGKHEIDVERDLGNATRRRTAAGSMCLIGSGVNDPTDAVLGPALKFLRQHFRAHLKGAGNWYWYGQYYCAQALFHSPNEQDWDDYWNEAWRTIADYQDADGSWSQPDGYGPGFGTAMALIILQIPNNYLPIFQR
jgi:hypothetical protein